MLHRLGIWLLPIGCLDLSPVAADLQNVQPHSVQQLQDPIESEATCSNNSGEGCSSENSEEKKIPSNQEECGIWLAPSSIPGAGLGMYAGRSYEAGELLGHSGEVVVPQVDINQHQFELVDKNEFFLLWDEYTWSGFGLHMGHEAFIEVKAQSPGFGSAANSFIDLINVDELLPQNTIPHDLHRSEDPGAGAFSSYHNRESIARVPIQKGEEFFVDYGQTWFRDRSHLGAIPLMGDLEAATKMFQRHLEIRLKHKPKVPDIIFDVMWRDFVFENEWKESRVMGAFQAHQPEWEGLFQGKTLKQIRIEEGLRTEEWLREHGTCGDNIREGDSTIRQAGRGAFATRRLVKGSVIAPLPLIHISDYGILDMLEFQDIRNLKTEKVKSGVQMTMNYCFGHKYSTLLLCPYGPLTSLINHNQTLANVRLQWADPSTGNHEPTLLETPIEHFAKDKTAKLAMELVATRQIMPDEEIFLDYGDEWEAAWQQHVQNWEPSKDAESYISAHQLNTAPEPLRTEFEQMHNPYPGNVDLQCNQKFFQVIEFDHFQQTGEVVIKDHHSSLWLNCEVLRYEQVNGTFRYTAVIMLEGNKNDKLAHAPIEAFRFVDRPYTSDMFLPNAFRHAMQVPDPMFPEYWMNL